MSRVATDWAWGLTIKPASLKLLLLSMADRADEDHCCWPSAERLVKDTGLNKKTVQKGIGELESMGVIKDTKERKGRTQRVRVFRLIVGLSQLAISGNKPKNGPVSPVTPPAGEGGEPSGNDTEIGNIPKNGVLNDPNFGVQNQSVEPSSSTRACVREDNSPDPGGDTRPRFVMFADWEVQESFLQSCQIRGLLLEKLDPHILSDEVRDFVCYWMARPETVLTQSLWENKLAQHLQRGIRRGVFNTDNTEFGYAKQSGHSEKPKSAAQLHAESCAGAWNYYADQAACGPHGPYDGQGWPGPDDASAGGGELITGQFTSGPVQYGQNGEFSSGCGITPTGYEQYYPAGPEAN